MKTPEDEAFDDLARNQGAWGGGFPAKRAMAADKLQEPVTVPAQKPCGWQFYSAGKWHNGIGTNDHRANIEADGIPTRNVYTWDDCLETVARVWGALGPSTPLPAQEPAAMDNHQTLEALKYAASMGYGRIARKNSAPFTIKEASAQQAQEPDWKTMPPKDAPLVQWVKEQTTPPLPAQQVQFLAGGTRFKLSLDDDGKVNCFGHWKELDGRWVALVAAEDDCHLKLTAPLPAQETVAWALEWTFDGEEKSRRLYDDERHCKLDAENDGGICRPLVYGYTAPTPREWVGLTAEEIASIPLNEHTLQTAERLLKEKNT